MSQIILVRHGQSQWNLENKFTGWVDAPLTDKGVKEAQRAGQKLKEANIHFTYCFTSYLRRAIKTLWFILDETEKHYLPVEKHWRLNERHYGGLQGLNKEETAQKHGADQVKIWRRSYSTPPPQASGLLQEQQMADPRYKGLSADAFPRGESLEMTVNRVVPYWLSNIQPQVEEGKDLLIAAHGNSLRALVKYLSGMSNEEITEFEFPTGVPLVCKLRSHSQLETMKFLE